LKFPTIVQACIPHDISQTEQQRFAVSMILRRTIDSPGTLLTMDQALCHFRDYIKS